MGKGPNPSPLAIKVYVVFQWMNLARSDEQNSRIIATRLTRSAAMVVQEMHPGTWIEKYVATK